MQESIHHPNHHKLEVGLHHTMMMINTMMWELTMETGINLWELTIDDAQLQIYMFLTSPRYDQLSFSIVIELFHLD